MRNRGFTLIELLVVISIIGVIASIVLVSFSGSRDKAKLAKSQQFSANINHSLGAYAVGIWDFEDQDNPTADRSGFGNDGTLYDNTHFVANDVLGGHALSFDGSGDYVNCGQNANLNVSNLVTVSAWIKPRSGGGYAFAKDHYTRYAIWIATNLLRTYIMGTSYTTNFAFPADSWTHIVSVYDQTNSSLKHYINGKEMQKFSPSAVINSAGLDFVMGKRCDPVGNCGGACCYFNGSIDDVRIYNEVLSTAQIQQHYVQGAAKHGIALK